MQLNAKGCGLSLWSCLFFYVLCALLTPRHLKHFLWDCLVLISLAVGNYNIDYMAELNETSPVKVRDD